MNENSKNVRFNIESKKLSPTSKKSNMFYESFESNKYLYKTVFDFFIEEGITLSNSNTDKIKKIENLNLNSGLSKEATITDKSFYKLLKQLNLTHNFDNIFEITTLISKYKKLHQKNNLVFNQRNKSSGLKNIKNLVKLADIKRNQKRPKSFNSIHIFHRENTIDLNTCYMIIKDLTSISINSIQKKTTKKLIKNTFDTIIDDFIEYKENELFENIENSILNQQESLVESLSLTKIINELLNYFDSYVRYNLSNEMKNMLLITSEINSNELLQSFEQINYLVLSIKSSMSLIKESNCIILSNLRKNDEENYKLKNLVTSLNGRYVNKKLLEEMEEKSPQKINSKLEVHENTNKNELSYYDDVSRLTAENINLKEKIKEISSHYIKKTSDLNENLKQCEITLNEQININENIEEKYNEKVIEYNELKSKYEKWMDELNKLNNEENTCKTKRHKSQFDFSKIKKSLDYDFSEDNLLQTNKVDLVYMITENNLKLNKLNNELNLNYDLVDKYKALNKDLCQDKMNLYNELEKLRNELDKYKYTNTDLIFNSNDNKNNNYSLKKSMLNCLTLEDLDDEDLFDKNTSNFIELKKSSIKKANKKGSDININNTSEFMITNVFNLDYPIQFSIFCKKKLINSTNKEKCYTPENSLKRLELNTDKSALNKFNFLLKKDVEINSKINKLPSITKSMIETNINKTNLNNDVLVNNSIKNKNKKKSKFVNVKKTEGVEFQNSSSESNANSYMSIVNNSISKYEKNDKIKIGNLDLVVNKRNFLQNDKQLNFSEYNDRNDINFDLLFLGTNEYVVRFLKKCSEDYHDIYSSEIILLGDSSKDTVYKKILITKNAIYVLNDSDFYAIKKILICNITISVFKPNIVVLSKSDFPENKIKTVSNFNAIKSHNDADQSLFTYKEEMSDASNKSSYNKNNPFKDNFNNENKVVLVFQDFNISQLMKYFNISNFGANYNPNYLPKIIHNFSFSKKVGILFMKKESFFSTYYENVLIELTFNHLIIHHNFLSNKKMTEVIYLDKATVIFEDKDKLDKTISMKSTETFKAEVDEAKLLKLKHLAFSGIKYDSTINNRRFDIKLESRKITFVAHNNRLAESWYSEINEIIESLQ